MHIESVFLFPPVTDESEAFRLDMPGQSRSKMMLYPLEVRVISTPGTYNQYIQLEMSCVSVDLRKSNWAPLSPNVKEADAEASDILDLDV